MVVTPIKTERISPGSTTLFALLDTYLESMSENSVLAIASKVVSLCENNVVAKSEDVTKQKLIEQESSYYLPTTDTTYGHQFTITNHRLIPAAGIDESNADDSYILWPKNAQKTANEVRKYLMDRFNIQNVGVIITDSNCTPLVKGTTGIVQAHSGFQALNDYVGTPDLFGRPFTVTRTNIPGGLAASAVVVMGDGTEQTPLALISDVPFVSFQDHDPNEAELAEERISKEEDLFAPFLDGVGWLNGKAGNP